MTVRASYHKMAPTNCSLCCVAAVEALTLGFCFLQGPGIIIVMFYSTKCFFNVSSLRDAITLGLHGD